MVILKVIFFFILLTTSTYSFAQSNHKINTVQCLELHKMYKNKILKNINIFAIKNKLFYHDLNFFINLNNSNKVPFMISQVNIIGNIFHFPEDLKIKLFDINYRKIYNINKLLKIKLELYKFFFNTGYIKSKIFFTIKINPYNKHMILYFHVYLGKQFLINKVQFSGNIFTHNSILHHIVQTLEGKPFNYLLIQEGKDKLENTGYVKDISCKILLANHNINKLNVIYVVSEKNSDTFHFRLGNNFFYQFNINMKLHYNNIMGSGKKIDFNILKTHNNNSFYLSYLFPDINNKNMSVKNGIFYDYLNNNIKSIAINKRRINYGLENIVNIPISKKTNVEFCIKYSNNISSNINLHVKSWKNIRNILDNIHNIIFNGKSHTNITLLSSWIYNNIHQKDFLNFGRKLSISSKLFFNQNNNNFHKEIVKFEEYLPFNKDKTYILNTCLKLGFGSNFDKEDFLFDKNFYLNEHNFVHGFNKNIINFNNFNLYHDHENNFQNKKSNLFKLNHEINNNIFLYNNFNFIIPNFFCFYKNHFNNVYTSVFFDIGSSCNILFKNFIDLFNQHIKIENHSFFTRSSTGIALQLNTPLGRCCLSYSFPIVYSSKDILESFQLSIN